jgi:hypothetical protein
MIDFRMEPVAAMLNKVDIVEVATLGVAKRLERVGFNWRKKSNGEGGTFITPADIQKRKAITLADMLSAYGIHDRADFRVDRMPLDYYDIQDYPAELIAGIEIYRHNRPTQFGGTRGGATLLSPGGMSNLFRPLVLVWTYIP